MSEHTETELDDDKLESADNLPHQQLDLDAETVSGAGRVALPHLTLRQGLGGRCERVGYTLKLRSESRGRGRLREDIGILGHSSSGLVYGGGVMSVRRHPHALRVSVGRRCSLLMLAV